jgi:hypothetical protein
VSGVDLVHFHSSLIYHVHTPIGYFTRMCPVDLILSILSICLHFPCCLTDSLLMHLSHTPICLSIFRATFLFHFRCVHLEIFMDPEVVYIPRCVQYSLESF